MLYLLSSDAPKIFIFVSSSKNEFKINADECIYKNVIFCTLIRAHCQMQKCFLLVVTYNAEKRSPYILCKFHHNKFAFWYKKYWNNLQNNPNFRLKRAHFNHCSAVCFMRESFRWCVPCKFIAPITPGDCVLTTQQAAKYAKQSWW